MPAAKRALWAFFIVHAEHDIVYQGNYRGPVTNAKSYTVLYKTGDVMKEPNIQKECRLKPARHQRPTCQMRLGFAILLILCLSIQLAAGESAESYLTPVQRQWLIEHPNVRIGVTTIPPQVFYDDQDGRLTGLCIDTIRAVEKYLGYSFKMEYFSTWKEMIDAVEKGNIDVVYAAQRTPKREAIYKFTKPYLEFENMIVTSNEVQGPIGLKDLSGKKVAVVGGNSIEEDLTRLYPDILRVPVENESQGLLLVSFKEADAMIIEPSRAGYIIQEKKITNLRVTGRTEMYFRLGFMVRNEMAELTDILNAGLSAIPEEEKTAIRNRWVFFTLPTDLRKLWWLLGGIGGVALLAIVWNIVLRKQVERRTVQLREELRLRTDSELYRNQVEEQFRHVIEFCPLGVLLYRLENGDRLTLMAGNCAAEKILSLELRPLIGRTLEEIFPALKLTDIPDQYRKVCKTGIPWQSPMHDYDDQRIRGKYEIFAFQTSAGQIAVMFSDITNQIAARQAVEQSEAFLKSIFRAAPVGIGLLMGHIFKHINDRFYGMLGYTSDELLGHSARMVYATQEEFERVGNEIHAQLLQHGMATVQTRYRRKDGVILDILLCLSAIDIHDLSQGATFIVMDVTDQIAAQRSLAESQRALATLMENMPGAAYRCQNSQDCPVEFISKGCRELTGYDHKEFYDKPDLWRTLVDPEDRRMVWIQVQEAVARHVNFQMEYRIRTANGQEKWVWEQGCAIYDAAGNAVALEGFIIDITVRKQARQALQFFQFAVEHSGEAAHWIVQDAKLIYVNAAACQLLKYSREELLTMGVEDIDPNFTKAHWQAHWDELKEKRTLLFETLHTSKDGSVFPVEISANFVEFDGKEYNCTFVRDIRRRKQNEQSLKFFQFSVEHSGEAAYWVGSDAKFFYVNQAACTQLGYSREELLTLGISEIDVHFDMAGWDDYWARLRQDKIIRIESIHKTKDGQVFPVEVSGHFVEFEGNEYNCATVRDIREQKKVREQSLLSTERTEALLKINQMQDASLDRITEFALEEAVRLTKSKIGYLAFLNDDESVLTMHAWSKTAMAECAMSNQPRKYPVVSTGLWGEAVRQRKAIITNDYNAPNPLKKRYPEGHVMLTRHMNVPIIIKSKIVLVAGVGNKEQDYDPTDVQQITLLMEGMWRMIERISSEQELANSEKRFREMFQRISSAVAVYHAVDEGDDFVFTDFNPAAERTEKIKKENVLGRKVTEVFPGVKEFGILEVFRQVWKTGQPVHYPLKLYKDDRIFGWRDNYVYCLPNGEIVALYDDVTEQITAQHAREKLMKELQAKNEELESIVFVASHDLRSPLVNIQGFAGELGKSCRELTVLLGRETLSDGSAMDIRRILDEDIPESLSFISAGTNKMDALAKGLLRLARIGTVQMHIDTIDMNRLMVTILKTVQYQMREYGIEIRVDDLPQCLGDWVQLNQVFSNLIDNAIKFRHPTRKAVIEIQGSTNADRTRYIVRDNGIGIAPEHNKKIFEVFHRLNPAGPAKGEGLGLTIVQRILDRLDGKIHVESQPDIGAAFIIDLPAVQEKT